MSDPRRNVTGMNLPKRHSGRRHDPGCADCAKEAEGQPADRVAYMNWITEQIGTHGWAVSGIQGDEQLPPWAYSVGMWLTCQSVELVVCGPPWRTRRGSSTRSARGSPMATRSGQTTCLTTSARPGSRSAPLT